MEPSKRNKLVVNDILATSGDLSMIYSEPQSKRERQEIKEACRKYRETLALLGDEQKPK